MRNRIIWVDLDEVLAETVDYCLECNNYKIWDFEIKKEKIVNYYIHEIEWLNIDLKQAIDWFQIPLDNDILRLEIKPVKWAVEKILELKNAWNKIIVVTARSEERFKEYTEKWLDKYFWWLIDNIVFTDHFTDKHRDKWDVCRDLWIEFMIEDNMDYALDIAKKGIKTYLLDKPWNQIREEENKNLIRIKSWDEFLK